MMQGVDAFIIKELTRSFFGIAVYQYLLALFFILAGFTLRRLSEKALGKLAEAADKSKFKYDDMIIEIVRKPVPYVFVGLGIFLAIQAMPVPSEPVDVRAFMYAGLKSVTVLLVLWVALRLVDGVCGEWMKNSRGKGDHFDTQIIPIIRKTSKAFLGVVGGILFLQNMGYSVASLLAGFGLGGMAIALASKDSLSNLFGSVVVLLDRPFRVGDWIQMKDLEGTVEEIGLRTTRVRTFANSLLTVPNAKFTNGIINNWQRMNKRRITFRLGVSYDATPEQIETLVNNIREVIADDEDMNHDYYLVNFDNFGESSLGIFIYCFTKTTVWKDFLEVKQNFFLKLLRECRAVGVEIAFPTRTLHVPGPVPIRQVAPEDGHGVLS